MSFSNSRQSYKDCEEFLDKAIADEQGARRFVGERGQAEYFRARCNHFRVLDRLENRQGYTPGDPMYAKSVYDVMAIRIKQDTEGDWYVYAEKWELPGAEVEALSEIE